MYFALCTPRIFLARPPMHPQCYTCSFENPMWCFWRFLSKKWEGPLNSDWLIENPLSQWVCFNIFPPIKFSSRSWSLKWKSYQFDQNSHINKVAVLVNFWRFVSLLIQQQRDAFQVNAKENKNNKEIKKCLRCFSRENQNVERKSI